MIEKKDGNNLNNKQLDLLINLNEAVLEEFLTKREQIKKTIKSTTELILDIFQNSSIKKNDEDHS